jgi:hypothetical protein
MSKHRNQKTFTDTPAYVNPSGNKGDLYDEAKGHPHGGQHAGRQGSEGQHQQRPKPDQPGHPSGEKLGQKPPARRPPLD